MKKYTVTLEYIVRESVEVEADSPAEAAEAARDRSPEEVFQTEFNAMIPLSRLEDGQPINVLDEDGEDRTAEAGW